MVVNSDWLWYLAGVLIRPVALAAVAGAGLLVFRIRSAAVRHAVWTIAMTGMLLTALSPWVRSVNLPLLPAEPAAPLDTDRPLALTQAPARLQHAPLPVPEPRPAPDRAALVFGFVSLLFLVRLAYGYLFTVRLARASRPLGDDVYESTWITVPMTVGFLRPKVLLPVGWEQWSAPKLRSVLAHERAHVDRRDWAIAMLARLNLSIFWFHPLAWWLSRQLAVLAEHACDDAALLQVETREHYAQALLEMAAVVKPGRGRLLRETVAMAKVSDVRTRIDRILDESRRIPRPFTRRCWMVLLLCGLPPVFLASVVQVVPAIAQQPAAAVAALDPQALEQHLITTPHDLDVRQRLVAYYYARGIREPRLGHVFWLIENHPESAAAALASQGVLYRPTSLNDRGDFARAVALWKAQAANHFNDPGVLMNAAQFLAKQGGDMEEAERYLKAARDLEPENSIWTERLGQFYAAIVLGELRDKRYPWLPAMAVRVRSQLESSADAWLLYYAGTTMVNVAQDLDASPEVKSILDLGHRLKERADRASVPSRGALVWVQFGQSPGARAVVEHPAAVVRQNQPEYPALARQARISGIVPVQVTVGAGGEITRVSAVRGHPLLIPAAVAAVKNWTFRPGTTAGRAVESTIEVSVPFVLEQPAIPPTIRLGPAAMNARRVKQTSPEYPDRARQDRIEGIVSLDITVAEDGSVENVDVLEGHPVLAAAAGKAVREWNYQPTLLNGKAVKVVTTVEIPFRLN